jgi:hypothetical protein
MMKTSEQTNELIAALVKVQLPTLPKGAQGYGYKYTPLDVVIEAMRQPLAKHGLSIVQFPATPPVEYFPAVALTTRLMHTSGQWLEDTMIMPVPQVGKANDAQNYGAALTYARRYALTSILCIAADEDVEANPIPGNGQDTRGETSPQAQKVKTEPLFNGNVVDARAWLEDKIQDKWVLQARIAEALVMTGLYKDPKHVTNAMNSSDFQEMRDAGLVPDLRRKVTAAGGLAIFDLAVARKEEEEG